MAASMKCTLVLKMAGQPQGKWTKNRYFQSSLEPNTKTLLVSEKTRSVSQ
jgi:hypothetical protein